MKAMKKAVVSAMALVLLATAGCTTKVDYPVLEAADTTGMTLASAQNSSVMVSYPEEGWTANTMVTPMTLFYTETMETDRACNINIQLTMDYNGSLTENDLEELVAEIENQYADAITVEESQMRLLYDKPVIYIESTTQFTEQYIDIVLEGLGLTEEELEAMGGREALMDVPPASQIMLYTVSDGHLFLYVGTYYDEAQKQVVLDTITVLAANTKAV